MKPEQLLSFCNSLNNEQGQSISSGSFFVGLILGLLLIFLGMVIKEVFLEPILAKFGRGGRDGRHTS